VDLSKINYLAVFVAALSCFLVGGFWYSPLLFEKAWRRETRLTDDAIKSKNMTRVFGTSFLLCLVMAFNLAAFLAGPPNPGWGVAAGFLAGFGWVALGLGVTYLFEGKSFLLWLIDGGYHTVSFMLMGAILGAWK
jgi:hypothetical protein